MAAARQYQLVQKDFYSEEEYFEIERTSLGRLEYVNGEIRAMSGGTADHSTISMNIGATLRSALLSKGCRVFGSDMKVHTNAWHFRSINTFPDISAVCGPPEFYQGRKDIYSNPLLIVEVLSDSTAAYDMGDKFRYYQTIPSLIDYLLVAQDESRVLLYTRRADHWDFRDVTGLGSAVHLPSVDVTLPLSDIYALVDLPPDLAERQG